MPVWWSFLKGRNVLLLAGLLLAGTAGIGLYSYLKNTDKKNITQNNQQENAELNENKSITQKISTATYKSKSEEENTASKNYKTNDLENEKLIPEVITTKIGGNKIFNNSNNLIPSAKLATGKNKETARNNSHNNYSLKPVENNSSNILKYDLLNDATTVVSGNPEKKNKVLKKTKGRANYAITNGEAENNINDQIIAEGFLTQGSLIERLKFEAEKITASSLIDAELKTNTITTLPFKDPGCPTPENDAAGNKQYWELYAGPDYAIKKFTDTANSAYLEKRKSSTSYQSAYSAGARYTRVFNNGISIRGGINYSQVNEKFSFVQGNTVQVTYILNTNGDTVGSNTIRGTRYKTTYNHYHTIDAPILIGYEVGNGKLHINLNAGAVVNIYSWQKGDLLDTSFQPVNITTGKGLSQYQYKTNIGIGFMGAVSVYYKLNGRLHLLAEPFLRYNFSPMSKDNFSLQEKFTTVGLRLGIRVDLK